MNKTNVNIEFSSRLAEELKRKLEYKTMKKYTPFYDDCFCWFIPFAFIGAIITLVGIGNLIINGTPDSFNQNIIPIMAGLSLPTTSLIVRFTYIMAHSRHLLKKLKVERLRVGTSKD